jgi:NAD(P)-dependent dehydrogenase (short-subunit alcohol dehydrogenase family)
MSAVGDGCYRGAGMRFANRSVVVTGGGTGIGRGVALAFAAQGADVLVAGRREDRLMQVAAESDKIAAFAGDITDAGVAAAVVSRALERSGRLDVVVNNAGRLLRGSLASTSPSDIQDIFSLHVVGPALVARAAVPELERVSGSIVNVSSIVAHHPSASAAYYGASKLAIEYLTRCWAVELAPQGIRVNAVAPGPTKSEALVAAELSAEEIARANQAQLPLGRRGRPDDIAYWVLAFADSAAEWVTGQVVSVDGGAGLTW